MIKRGIAKIFVYPLTICSIIALLIAISILTLQIIFELVGTDNTNTPFLSSSCANTYLQVKYTIIKQIMVKNLVAICLSILTDSFNIILAVLFMCSLCLEKNDNNGHYDSVISGGKIVLFNLLCIINIICIATYVGSFLSIYVENNNCITNYNEQNVFIVIIASLVNLLFSLIQFVLVFTINISVKRKVEPQVYRAQNQENIKNYYLLTQPAEKEVSSKQVQTYKQQIKADDFEETHAQLTDKRDAISNLKTYQNKQNLQEVLVQNQREQPQMPKNDIFKYKDYGIAVGREKRYQNNSRKNNENQKIAIKGIIEFQKPYKRNQIDDLDQQARAYYGEIRRQQRNLPLDNMIQMDHLSRKRHNNFFRGQYDRQQKRNLAYDRQGEEYQIDRRGNKTKRGMLIDFILSLK